MNNGEALYLPGYVPGCLPRKSKPGEWCPLAAERIKLIPKSDWPALAKEISLRPHVKTVLNQGSVGSCFPPGTLIRLGGGHEVPIESVKVLDEVVTAEGNVRKVTQTMARFHSGTVLRLLINGSHHVRCTPEHPILTKRGYVPASALQKGDMVAFPRYAAEASKFIQCADYVWERRYTGARRIVRGKCGSVSNRSIPGRKAGVVTKHPLPDVIYLTEGFGRLVGLFLAEGCTSYGKVTFTFSADEEHTLAAEVVHRFKDELGVTATVQRRGASHTVKVNVHGVLWAQLFEALCGKLARAKTLHPDLCAGPIEFLNAVLSGWCDGDGISPGRFGGGSTSHVMAMQMFDIACATGRKPTIRVRVPKLSHGVKSRQPVWTVEWGEGLIIQPFDYRKTQDDLHLWRYCEGVSEEQYEGYVFNLEVEDDHSYVAEGIGVHNCATEATAGAMMIARSMEGLEHIVLNPWFIYNTTSGGRDAGSSIDENLAFVRENGCAPESVWPRSKGWSARPSEEAKEAAKKFKIEEFYDIQSIDEMVSALLTGFPVVYGANGHAVCKIQHVDESQGLDLNSWGTSWKDGGFGVWVSYRGVNWGYGAWALRVAT